MRVANPQAEPLVIERALSTTGIDDSRLKECFIITDHGPYESIASQNYGQTTTEKVRHEATEAGMVPFFAQQWEKINPQLIVSSSHATQYNLEMPFGKGLIASMGNQFHVLKASQLREFASFLKGALFEGSEKELADFLKKSKSPVLAPSPEPKVWIASGNCLFGNANKSANSMVVTALSSGGAQQVVGYTVPSWYGKAGWGTLNTFFANTEATPLAHAFFLNNQLILKDILEKFPELMPVNFKARSISEPSPELTEFLTALKNAGYAQNQEALGLSHDRDTLAFFGNPLSVAILDPKSPSKSPWRVSPQIKSTPDGTSFIEIEALKDHSGIFSYWFNKRLASSEKPYQVQQVLEGSSKTLSPSDCLITNDFMIIPHLELKKGQKVKLLLP